MKLIKLTTALIFIIIACYWFFKRDLSISPFLFLVSGFVFIIIGLEKMNCSVNKRSEYLQSGGGIVLGIFLILVSFF